MRTLPWFKTLDTNLHPVNLTIVKPSPDILGMALLFWVL